MKIKDVFLFKRISAVIIFTISLLLTLSIVALRPVTLHGHPSLGHYERVFENLNNFNIPVFKVSRSTRKVEIPFKSTIVIKKKIQKRVRAKRAKIVKIPSLLIKAEEIVVKRFVINVKNDQKFLNYLSSYRVPLIKHRAIAKIKLVPALPIKSIMVAEAKKKKVLKKVKKIEKDMVTDIVSEKLSARVAQKVIKSKVTSQVSSSDDLVLYDYSSATVKEKPVEQLSLIPHVEVPTVSKPKKPITSIAVVAKQKISLSVQRVIDRVKNPNTAILDKAVEKFLTRQKMDSQKTVAPTSPSNNSILDSQLLAAKSMSDLLHNSDGNDLAIKVKLLGAVGKSVQASFASKVGNFVNITSENIFNFYDVPADVKGSTHLTIRAKDIISTRVNVDLANDRVIDVPMLSYEMVAGFLDSEAGLDDFTYLLVRRNFDGQAVDVDSNYEKIVYLDSNFEQTSDDITYELFIGIEAGIRTLSYLSAQKKDFEIVFSAWPGIVTFKQLEIESDSEMNVQFVEYHLGREININDQVDVDYLNKKINTYHNGAWLNFLLPSKNRWMNDYLTVKRDNEQFYVGLNRSKTGQKVTLLSEYVIDQFYDFSDVQEVDKQCVIQINLAEKLDELDVELEAERGINPGNVIFLDSDGEFYDELSSSTKFAFIMSDKESAVHLHLKGINGEELSFSSFCQPGTFIIENL